MLLILVLAAGTIAVKLLADDEAADEAAAARRRLTWQQRRYRLRASHADRLISAADSAWRDLRTLRDDLIGLLRIKMLSAWEGFILRVRSLHRMAGNVTAAPWPVGGDLRTSHQEFEGVPQPAMELGPLYEVCRLIDEQHPDRLRAKKREITEQYADQVGAQPVRAAEPEASLVDAETVLAARVVEQRQG